MANFWDDLGNTLPRKAKGLSSRAENLYEIQKIRNKLSAQERMTEKLMMDIGKLIYTRYEHGEAVDGEVGAICEEISQHMLEADHFRDAIAASKGEKFCPACHKAVMREASFCPYCGAACPTAELEEKATDVIEQAEEEVGYKPPKYAFDLQIMMLPDEGLVLVLSEKEPLENKSGAQLLQALQEMKRVFEEKKAEIGAAEKKAQAGENAGESGKKNKKAAEAQKPQFAIFAFRNIGRVIEYAAVLPTNLRIDSTLYRMEDGTCYAYVRKGGASYERYSRACIQAMEFAALYAADEQKLRYLEEHGECLIREKALKKLRV